LFAVPQSGYAGSGLAKKIDLSFPCVALELDVAGVPPADDEGEVAQPAAATLRTVTTSAAAGLKERTEPTSSW
jgi:hypothetical protein